VYLFGKKILFLGAHPDDIELGCGALLANISKRVDILAVTLSDNQKNAALKNVVDEHYCSMEILGRNLTPSCPGKPVELPLSSRCDPGGCLHVCAQRPYPGDVMRSSYGFFPHFLIEVTQEDVEKKVEALLAYETYKDKYYFSPEIIRSTSVRHGSLAERPFAEGFDILRVIGNFGLDG